MVPQVFASWLLTQATPPEIETSVRGLDAVAAADGWVAALMGMGVVFSALFALFLLMIALRRTLEPRPQPKVEATPPAPALTDEALGAQPAGLPPRLAAAIAVAIRLEQQRLVAAAIPPQPSSGSGWIVSRSLQWASHQQIFLRPRR